MFSLNMLLISREISYMYISYHASVDKVETKLLAAPPSPSEQGPPYIGDRVCANEYSHECTCVWAPA